MTSQPELGAPSPDQQVTMTFAEISDVVIALWRAKRRADRFAETPQPVALAIQGAIERIETLGLTFRDMIGEPYDTNMRAHVVDTIEADGVPRIADCVSPGIYYNGVLVRPAEIVVTGGLEGDGDGQGNS